MTRRAKSAFSPPASRRQFLKIVSLTAGAVAAGLPVLASGTAMTATPPRVVYEQELWVSDEMMAFASDSESVLEGLLDRVEQNMDEVIAKRGERRVTGFWRDATRSAVWEPRSGTTRYRVRCGVA